MHVRALFLALSLFYVDPTMQHSVTASKSLNPNDSYITTQDQHILLNIRQHINALFGKKYETIAVSVSSGMVTFSGTVLSADDRMAIGNVALRVQGVVAVNNSLIVANKGQSTNTATGDSFSSYTDQQVILSIRNELRRQYGSKYLSLIINSDNGIVTIKGSVLSNGDMNRIIFLAQNVQGVQSVINELSVQSTSSPNLATDVQVDPRDSYATSNDRIIVINIRNQLASVPGDRYKNTYITVINGGVTLFGQVATKQEADAAANKAQHVTGVLSINNTLSYPK